MTLDCSVSLLLTTTEATVVDHPDEKNSAPSRMPAMDDMGYWFEQTINEFEVQDLESVPSGAYHEAIYFWELVSPFFTSCRSLSMGSQFWILISMRKHIHVKYSLIYE